MNWSASQAYISLSPKKTADADGKLSLAGIVDINAYKAWLADNYGITVETQ